MPAVTRSRSWRGSETSPNTPSSTSRRKKRCSQASSFESFELAVRKVDSKRRVSGAVLFVTWDETGFSQLGTLPASSGATLGVDYGTMPLLEIRAKESASPPTLFRLTADVAA